ncbi:methyl-accepting chemotaxis protein [Rubrivivax sp. A210]|uniref:methyl-accepting chemotaxis protein n=1 Tax=Rubrivivax sp. A210 TaxID=2772301 RepID=UPI00191B3647|nr:methyl-accepting chemotaxis protein [Rubrivivax sp. A210]
MLVSAVVVLPLLALMVWQFWNQGEQALQSRRDATRNLVEVVHSVLAGVQAQEAAGSLTRDQAQALALRTVKALRYDGQEYFWINDLQPRMVMHPMKPELDGTDLAEFKDPNGKRIFASMVEQVRRQGQGYVDYQWPRPGSAQPVDKVSYVMAFEPWGWVVGSGVYVDHLQAAFWRQHSWQLAVVVAAIALTFTVGGYGFVCFELNLALGLADARRHLRALAEGDLTTRSTPRGHDEAAELLRDMGRMQAALRGMVQKVRTVSVGLVQSSGEIASGAQDLSARTERAAANLQETAAAMEEMSSSSGLTAKRVADAAAKARENAGAASAGGRVMGEVERTMDSVRDSSARISEIIGTVNDIAFQTNILALNAAVEAARAGEQGRGFAVVATEVRSLAQRSALAAREIKSLVGGSVERVEAGVGIVRQAGTIVGGIVASSKAVDELLTGVAGAEAQQDIGIHQIGKAVHDLDELTQQNAALVEQTAAAAKALHDQANELGVEVSRFRLDAIQPA